MITLCLNCLQPGSVSFLVGADKGNQRNSYFTNISLCSTCSKAIENGQFDVLHDRYQSTRVFTRQEWAG